jgi:hypothetical protein
VSQSVGDAARRDVNDLDFISPAAIVRVRSTELIGLRSTFLLCGDETFHRRTNCTPCLGRRDFSNAAGPSAF